MVNHSPRQALQSAAAELSRTGADPRSQELAENLAAVHARIDRAMELAQRSDRPSLIVVTKFFPAQDVARLYRLGVRDVGENRDQEAAAKAAEVRELLSHDLVGEPDSDDHSREPRSDDPSREPRDAEQDLHWHFIGQLQSNKARSVIDYADHLHSVDRMSLVKALIKVSTQETAAVQTQAPLRCLIQVDLREPMPEDGRGGASPAQIPALAAAIDSAPGLSLSGLMAVAPLGEPAAPAFNRLQLLSAELRESYPQASMVSAGMSGDLEEGVASGATHLRVGRDVLGERPLQR